jgi:hypothetical protein
VIQAARKLLTATVAWEHAKDAAQDAIDAARNAANTARDSATSATDNCKDHSMGGHP